MTEKYIAGCIRWKKHCESWDEAEACLKSEGTPWGSRIEVIAENQRRVFSYHAGNFQEEANK